MRSDRICRKRPRCQPMSWQEAHRVCSLVSQLHHLLHRSESMTDVCKRLRHDLDIATWSRCLRCHCTRWTWTFNYKQQAQLIISRTVCFAHTADCLLALRQSWLMERTSGRAQARREGWKDLKSQGAPGIERLKCSVSGGSDGEDV